MGFRYFNFEEIFLRVFQLFIDLFDEVGIKVLYFVIKSNALVAGWLGSVLFGQPVVLVVDRDVDVGLEYVINLLIIKIGHFEFA